MDVLDTNSDQSNACQLHCFISFTPPLQASLIFLPSKVQPCQYAIPIYPRSSSLIAKSVIGQAECSVVNTSIRQLLIVLWMLPGDIFSIAMTALVFLCVYAYLKWLQVYFAAYLLLQDLLAIDQLSLCNFVDMVIYPAHDIVYW